MAVRAQKRVLTQPAATAAMAVQARSRATVAAVRLVLLLRRLARLVTTAVQAATLALAVRAAKVVRQAQAEAQQLPAQTATAATVARAVWAAAVQVVEQVRREPMQTAVLATWRVLVLPAALVAMVALEVPRDPSVALVVRAAPPESELMVATAEMPVQEEAEARAVWAWMGLLFCPLIVMARPAEEVATLVHQGPVETVRHLELRATVPLVATPVTAGLAETSPAQTKMAAREATAAAAVAQPAQAPLAMVALAAAAVLLAMGR